MTPAECPRCGTELAAGLLACPACATLLHAEGLKRIAAGADADAQAGNLRAARDGWTNALRLVPTTSQQHAAISARIDDLTRRIGAASPNPVPPSGGRRGWQGLAGLGTAALLAASKLKFLLLGLTKASTFFSMLAFFGVYWSVYGWPLALGLVVAIYIHEMGHVAMLRTLGIAAGAPMFIPGVGALVLLKQQISDPLTDAKIGLAGPIWGLGAALAALVAYMATGGRVWLAIAQLTGFINLFNLTPIWQLDGARGVHVLARRQRWVLVAAIGVALLLTEQRLLFLVGGVAVWRASQSDAGPGDTQTLATFIGLVIALSLLARGVG